MTNSTRNTSTRKLPAKAKIHGVRSSPRPGPPPVRVPQRWQNRARAVRVAWQRAQLGGPDRAPHLPQNAPLTEAPQEAQTARGEAVMAGGM